jgi:PAS domain S-box-containing protein
MFVPFHPSLPRPDRGARTAQQPKLLPERVFQAMPWGMLALDRQGVLRLLNPYAERLLGLSAATVLGQALVPALPAGFPADLAQALREASTADGPVVGTFFLPGREQWIEMTTAPGPDAVLVYWQDITRLMNQRQQYQALAENTPDVLTRWGPDLRLRYANPALVTKTGQPVPALLGKTFAEMGAPAAIVGPYMAKLQRVFDTCQPLEHFNAFPTPQGERYYHSRLVAELHDGHVHTVLAIARDVTALQQANTKLHANQELLQAVFDATLDSLEVLRSVRDADGQLVDFEWVLTNAAAHRLLQRIDLVGKRLLAEEPEMRGNGVFERLCQVVAGQPADFELLYPQDGGEQWFHVAAAPLGDGLVATWHNITDRKQAIAELLRLEQTQQQDLANAVLDAQEVERARIAEGLHNGLGQVLYAVQLRLGQLSVALDGAAFAQSKRQAEEMLQAAIAETRTLSHQLTPTVLADFGLATALRQICQDFSTSMCRLHCSATKLPLLPPALALAIYRMAQELAANVVQHANATEAHLRLGMHDGWLELRADDNGHGFDPALPRSDGRGLNALRDRARLLNGELTVASSPTDGTHILVRVPQAVRMNG